LLRLAENLKVVGVNPKEDPHVVINSIFDLKTIPADLLAPENAGLLTGMMRGIEKESLRVTSDGRLAQTPHPRALGSALTHAQITTDFSEALLEFITPPSSSINQLLTDLRNSHQFTYPNLGDELLWVNSMPCMMAQSNDIPVAQYGSSNRARMKTIYRIGLGHRYGRVMQTVAGVHFNFSLPDSFWALKHEHESSKATLKEYTTRCYFDMIRNFRRHYWLLIYLFGSSPAICRSFVRGREHTLLPLDEDQHTLHRPYATSLRMGDLGYQSSAQESLYVCYNSLSSYVRTLTKAIATPYPPYEQLGVQDAAGEYVQLNTSMLQIENEFYSAIRPKRTAQKSETALTALCQRGVEYIEVRCLDLDPYSPIGVTEQQIRFLDTFLLYCALQESPACDRQEFERIALNQKRVVNEGRKPGLLLQRPDGVETELKTWATQLIDALIPLADLLDQANNTHLYREALLDQHAKILDANLTPSAKVLADLRTQKLTFAQWGRQRAEAHRGYFNGLSPNPDNDTRFKQMAADSLQQQVDEEHQPQLPFNEYLATYYEQYQNCGRQEPSVCS
jgi:glutamate--cysteine ligase